MVQVLTEVPALVCEQDLHCAQTALSVVRAACLRAPRALTPEARAALTPNILLLANSPLLQGEPISCYYSCLFHCFPPLLYPIGHSLFYSIHFSPLLDPVGHPLFYTILVTSYFTLLVPLTFPHWSPLILPH